MCWEQVSGKCVPAGSAVLLPLRSFHNELGALSVAELGNELPFEVRRIYIIHEQSGGATRGVHAHKTLRQAMICMSGTVSVMIDNGTTRETFELAGPGSALIVEPVVWREVRCNQGGVLAVLASELFDPDDYLAEHQDFLDWLESGG
jgi:WxcM-like, C-terminal